MPGTGSKMFSMPSPCFAQYFGISCYSDVHCLVTHFTVNWIGPFLILFISLPTCFAVVCQAEGGWAWTQAEQGLPPMVWVRQCGTEFLRGSAGSICCISHFAAQEAAICFLTWLCHHLWNWTTCYKKHVPQLRHNPDWLPVHVTTKSRHPWSAGSSHHRVILGTQPLPCVALLSVPSTLLSSTASLSGGQGEHGALRPWCRNGAQVSCPHSWPHSVTYPRELPGKPGHAGKVGFRRWGRRFLVNSLL